MSRFTNLFIVTASILFSLVVLEVASRYVAPISPGARFLDLGGVPLSSVEANFFHYKPDLKYRQVSTEFDALTSIDGFGNRQSTLSDDPDILFLGDSFTFGHGLADKDNFVSIYCTTLDLTCGNLARPGLGTAEELMILEYYLTKYVWRPKTVKLFLFAMTDALMSGNDLYDNYLFEKRNIDGPSSGKETSDEGAIDTEMTVSDMMRSTLQKTKNIVLAYSNLGRFAYFTLGHRIRAILSPPASQEVLDIGLKVTVRELNKLMRLSEEYGFRAEIYVIHPIQDLIRGTVDVTMQTLRDTVPDLPMVSSASIYMDDPRSYYFPYDGHLNVPGARKMADFLINR
jgi:hypothetical protein